MSSDTVIDFITDRPVPLIGPELNRQQTERLLVEQKGFARSEIGVDVPIAFEIDWQPYRSRVDLVVSLDGVSVMAVKCAAGSLESRQREILAAARLLLTSYQIPLAVACDGTTALVWETETGRRVGQGLAAIPVREEARNLADRSVLKPLPPGRHRKEMLIFRSYDSMNVNVSDSE